MSSPARRRSAQGRGPRTPTLTPTTTAPPRRPAPSRSPTERAGRGAPVLRRLSGAGRRGPVLRGLFVTGTDTGVGKTTVSRGLLYLARRVGLHLIPFKPVETGCTGAPADARALWRAAGQPVPRSQVCLRTFASPVAPAVAAAAAGVRITLGQVLTRARRLAACGDGLLVEGSGGLLVPYAPALTAADMAAALGLPLLLVARATLGTINHTALTVREIHRRGLPLAGIVLVDTDGRATADRPGNAAWIERVCGVRPLASLPFLPDADDRTLAAACSPLLGGLLTATWPSA